LCSARNAEIARHRATKALASHQTLPLCGAAFPRMPSPASCGAFATFRFCYFSLFLSLTSQREIFPRIDLTFAHSWVTRFARLLYRGREDRTSKKTAAGCEQEQHVSRGVAPQPRAVTRRSQGNVNGREDCSGYRHHHVCVSAPSQFGRPRETLMLEQLEQQKRLTANQWKLIATTNLADLLDFFDLFLIGYVLASLPKNGN
jgi:hypothetical protein